MRIAHSPFCSLLLLLAQFCFLLLIGHVCLVIQTNKIIKKEGIRKEVKVESTPRSRLQTHDRMLVQQ